MSSSELFGQKSAFRMNYLMFIIDAIFLEMLAIINKVKGKYGSCQQ
jgi:hypothetical protein